MYKRKYNHKRYADENKRADLILWLIAIAFIVAFAVYAGVSIANGLIPA